MYNYSLKLKEKNIEVVPLEEYNGSSAKILHKCSCGNNWAVTPNNVLRGQKCECNRYISVDKTILYYIKLNDLWEIGITSFSPKYSSIEKTY